MTIFNTHICSGFRQIGNKPLKLVFTNRFVAIDHEKKPGFNNIKSNSRVLSGHVDHRTKNNNQPYQSPLITKKADDKPQKELPDSVSNFLYLNPLICSSEYWNLYYDEMLGFSTEILRYTEDLIKEHPNYEISLFFRDLNTGNSFGINEEKKFTPASLMKIPILIAVLKEAQENPNILNKRIGYVQDKGKSIHNEDEFEYRVNVSYTIKQYLEIMIQYSDNHAAITLIDQLWIEKIKKVENDLLLGSEKIIDRSMRTMAVKKFATVFRVLYNASYLNEEYSNLALKILTLPNYHNGIRRAIPKEVAVAHKFGIREVKKSTDKKYKIEQLHHFGLVYRPRKPYLLGIMLKGDDKELMEQVIYEIALRIDNEIVARIDDINAKGVLPDAR